MTAKLFWYIKGNSILHTLDARVKIISLMCISILIFHSSSWTSLLVFTAIFILCILIANIGYAFVFQSVRPLLIFFSLIFLIHSFFTEGTAIFNIQYSPTIEGISKASILTGKFILLIIYSALLTATTRPALTTTAIERLLRHLPLKKIGTNSFEIATMMSLCLHFIPYLLWYADQIKDAQTSRGLKYSKNPITGMLSIVIPLSRGAMRMAEDIAIAMESRCYQSNFRTSMFELKMNLCDWIVGFFAIGITTAILSNIWTYFIY